MDGLPFRPDLATFYAMFANLLQWITRRDPDGFLWQLQSQAPDRMAGIVETVRAKAEAISGQPVALKGLLKRARLFRLGKALATGDQNP